MCILYVRYIFYIHIICVYICIIHYILYVHYIIIICAYYVCILYREMIDRYIDSIFFTAPYLLH